MCGFVGGTDPDWNYAAALAAIAHRGPDASELDLTGPVRVGFRRLSIIDLRPSANQPMLAPDGASWIVFNGEIYGYRELRSSLIQRGHVFRTDSDTEVALHAYLEWGGEFVERIDGMFAIAIWDARARKLKLYRDRPGIKPLYYYYDGRRFAFASELKALEKALRAARARGRSDRVLRLPRLSVRAGAEDAVQALLQAAARSRARLFARHGRAVRTAPLLEPAGADRAAPPAARGGVRRAALADRRFGRRADDRGRAARILPFGRRRLEHRRGRGGGYGRARRHVLDRLRRRRSIGDAVRARGRAALRHGSPRAHPVASARAGAAAETEELVRRAVRRRVVDADVSRLCGRARARDGRAHGRRRRRSLRRLSHLSALRSLRALAELASRHGARQLRAAPAVPAPSSGDARADAARNGVQRRAGPVGQAHGRDVDAREACRMRASSGSLATTTTGGTIGSSGARTCRCERDFSTSTSIRSCRASC